MSKEDSVTSISNSTSESLGLSDLDVKALTDVFSLLIEWERKSLKIVDQADESLNQ